MTEEMVLARAYPELDLNGIDRFFKTHRGEKFKSHMAAKYEKTRHEYMGRMRLTKSEQDYTYSNYVRAARTVILEYALQHMPKNCFYYADDLNKSWGALRYMFNSYPCHTGVYVGKQTHTGAVAKYETNESVVKLFVEGYFMEKPDIKISFEELKRYKKGMQHHVDVAQKYIDAVKEATNVS